MYNCDVCTTPSKPSAKQLKIIVYREKLRTYQPPLKEIQKEIKVCTLCYEGHKAGIPLNRLAQMHRPVSKPVVPAASNSLPEPTDLARSPAPPGGAILKGSFPSPREEAPKPFVGLLLQPSKAERLIASMEESPRYRTMKKNKPKQVKYENHKAKRKKTDGKPPDDRDKPGGAKAPVKA